MEQKTTSNPLYDSETGQFRGICKNPDCCQPFWGRRDRQYCGRMCKNQVGNQKWRAQNPKLDEVEKKIRKDARILQAVGELYGFDKWIDRSILIAFGYKGDRYHKFKNVSSNSGEKSECIELHNVKLYISDSKKVKILIIN